MALPANALTLLATVKAELGISVSTHDTVLERLIGVASEAVARFCGRKLHYQAAIVETVRGYGGQVLLLKRTPIVSITSIVIDGTTLAADSYSIKDADVGSVYREVGWQWTSPLAEGLAAPAQVPGAEVHKYTVTYTGGWVFDPQAGSPTPARNAPYDLEQACIETVVHLWRFRGRFSNAKTEKEETSKVAWEGNAIPKPAQAILKRYRRVP